MRSSRLKAQGQAVIESLFTIMLFVMLTCVIAGLSTYLFMQFNLITAAREGSRAAAVNPNLKGANPATAQADVKNRVKTFFQSTTGQTLQDSQVLVTGPTGVVGQRTVSVQVSFNFTSPMNIPGFMGAPDWSNIPMTSVASMRYEE